MGRYVAARLEEKEVWNELASRLGRSSRIEGIEKVFVPFYEFEDDTGGRKWLVCATDVSFIIERETAPTRETADSTYPRGTLMPATEEKETARGELARHLGREGGAAEGLRYIGFVYLPYWVAYFRKANKYETMDFIVLDACNGDMDEKAKAAVARGFIELEQSTFTGDSPHGNPFY